MKKTILKLFDKLKMMFSFEAGIDITDDTAVLYRRNIVIKNIIFLSNIAYTIILFVISFTNPNNSSNWVLTIIFMPFTFFLNRTLKKLIYDDKKDIVKQQVAMYMASFYMFLSSIFIYFRLKSGNDALSEAGYILLYYSLVVVSLYQDRKMLASVYKWMLVIVTILHFTLTYNIYSEDYATDLIQFLKVFFRTEAFSDIALRTMILILFMIVVYSSVQLSQYVYDERKTEIKKRKGIQTDFSDVVSDLFEVILNTSSINDNTIEHINLVKEIANRLAIDYKLNEDKINTINEYVLIHVNERDNLKITRKEQLQESDYQEIRRRSEIGAIVAKRIQLERKCEDIVRIHIEGNANKDFVARMNTIQNNIEAQTILLADIYVTLREAKSYKRPYSHKLALECINEEMGVYFDERLFDKFIKNNKIYEDIYNG